MKKRNASERKKERQTVKLIGSVLSAHLNANHPSFCLPVSLTQTYTCEINKGMQCSSIDNDWQIGQMVIYQYTDTAIKMADRLTKIHR